VLGYIPYHGYGKGKAKKQTAEMKLQDEHNCLSLITNQIDKIHEEGERTEVMGQRKGVKLWIHFIAGDTSGHNNIVGYMNGGQPKFIYHDCRCLFDDLSSPIPMCSLITSEELKQAHLTDNCLTNLCKKIFPMLLRMSLLVT
jgi:hypothetical protein